MGEAKWWAVKELWIYFGGEVHGPYDMYDLALLWEQGKVPDETMICRCKWMPLDAFTVDGKNFYKQAEAELKFRDELRREFGMPSFIAKKEQDSE